MLREGQVILTFREEQQMAKLKSFSINIGLPYIGSIEGIWEPDETEKRAAWEMYIELITRVSLVELHPGEGILQEALSSLYTLFDTTRTILREHGPSVARPKGNGKLSFGYLAIVIINFVLRPILSKWHPILLGYENAHTIPPSNTQVEPKRECDNQLRQELNEARIILIQYASILAQIAEVPMFVV